MAPRRCSRLYATTVSDGELLYVPCGFYVLEKHTAQISIGLKVSFLIRDIHKVCRFGMCDLARLAEGITATGPAADALTLMRTAKDAMMTEALTQEYAENNSSGSVGKLLVGKSGAPPAGANGEKDKAAASGLADNVGGEAEQAAGAAGAAGEADSEKRKGQPGPAPLGEESQDATPGDVAPENKS